MDAPEAADSPREASPAPEPSVTTELPVTTETTELPVTTQPTQPTELPVTTEPTETTQPTETTELPVTTEVPVITAVPAVGTVGESPAAAHRSRRRVSSPRTALRWITALWAALLVGASLLWPVSFGYDELQHFDMAYQYSQHPTRLYPPGGLGLSTAANQIFHLEPPNPKIGPFSTAPIAARGDRPTLAGLGGDAVPAGSSINQMVQHPPLYYELGAVVLRLPGVSHLAWDLQFWLVRLLSVLLMLPLPLLCFDTARRLARRMLPDSGDGATEPAPARTPEAGSTEPASAVAGSGATAAIVPAVLPTTGNRFSGRQNAIGLIAAVIPLTVPNLIRDGSAVTNDSLLILATSLFLYFLVRICLGELSRKVVAGASVAVTIALLTKGFALVLPPVLLVGLVIGWRAPPPEGSAARDRKSLAWVAGIFVAAMAVGGAWWLRNLVRYHAIQPNGFGPGANDKRYGVADNNGSFIKFFPDFFNQMVNRFWGGFALPDYPLGSSLSVWGWPVVLGCGIALALTVRRRRGITLLLLLGIVLTFLVVMQNSWSLYHTHSAVGVQAAQSRYLYHVVVALTAMSAVGWAAALRPRLTSALAYWVLLLGILTNASAWFMILDTWYSGGPIGLSTKVRNGLHGLLRWSPVPKPLTTAIFMIVAITAVLSLLQVRRYCRSLTAHEPLAAE